MLEHHERAIARVVEKMQADPDCLAVIVGGSLAHGLGRPDSDVDVMLVLTEEAFARKQETGELTMYAPELADYAGGYVDGKFVSRGFLEAAADHGSEPARFAFADALVPWTSDPDLPDLLRRVSAYPEAGRAGKMQGFVAQLQALQWYMGEAEKWDNPYLRNWVAVRAVLMGYRLILAHNRMLFPYHKWLTTFIERAPEKPDNLIALGEALLAAPSRETCDAFCEAVLQFHAWEMPPKGWPARFMQDSELNWLDGRPPLEDA
jgi:predicted nucleotidyltransferase